MHIQHHQGFALILIVAFLILGCSGGASPVQPGNENIHEPLIMSPPDDLIVSGRSLLMAYDVTCDFINEEITLAPLRTAVTHFDILPLLTNPWFCPTKNCLKLQFLEMEPDTGYFKIKATLVNPTTIVAHDVRGIIYKGDQHYHRMLNPDDYTKLWAPDGYDSIYPFRAFAKSDPDRAIHALMAFSEIYEFQFDLLPAKWNFPYAIDCSWPGNCEEVYEIHDQTQIGECYSAHCCIKLELKAEHHSGPAHITGVSVDTTPLIGEETQMEYNIDDDLWEALIIKEDLDIDPGMCDILITANSPGTEIKLYDYFHIDVKPSDEIEKVSGTVYDEDTMLGIPLALMTTSDGDSLYTAEADYCGYFSTGDVPDGSRVFSLAKPGYHTIHTMSIVATEDIVLEVFLPINPGDQPEMPVIDLNEPDINLITGIVELTGTIQNLDCLDSQRGVYVHQEFEYLMAVEEDGSFHQAVILAYGENTIVVRGTNATGTVLSDKITVEYYPDWNFRITLTWDTDETDIDLHVWEPNLSEHCYWFVDYSEHLELDYDDVYGYGPENITPTTDDLPIGDYPVAVDYYSGDDLGTDLPTTCFVTLRLNVGTPSEVVIQFEHLLTVADFMDYYPVQYNTESWWRPCDLVMLDTGVMTWQEPDFSYVLYE